MRLRSLFAATVLACAVAACGDAGSPTAPVAAPPPSENILVGSDTTSAASLTVPLPVGSTVDVVQEEGSAGALRRGPGWIGSGN